jgi:quinol monooxygenase YgiN
VIRVSGQLICKDADEAATVARALPEHVRLSRLEPGCLHFAVRPTADPLVWQVDEEFADPAAFAEHQQRTRASDWYRATARIRRDFVQLDA